MYRLIFLFLSSVLLFGCGGAGAYHNKLVAVDSLIAANLDDSARHVMEGIDVRDVKTNSDIAYYNMLAYELVFRQGEIPESDSTIDISIGYYKKAGDKGMLARSYYYKGRILDKRDSLKAAVECLKDAEEAAADIDDDLLKCKILGILASINIDCGESVKAIEPALRAVDYAEQAGDKAWLLSCLNTLSMAYGRIGKDDSARYYKEKYIPLIKYAPEKNQAVFWANLGSEYEKIGTDKAKEYVFRSLDILPRATTYRVLASIYLAEGNGTEAEKSWRKGLEICNDLHTRLNMLNDMLEYMQSSGRMAEAAALADSVFRLQAQLRKKWDEANVKAVQVQKDAAVEKGRTDKRKRAFVLGNSLIIAVLVIVIAGGLVAYRTYKRRTRRKMEEQESEIRDKEKAVERYERKMVKLEAKAEERKRTADNLRRNMKAMEERQKKEREKLRQTIAGNMVKGHRLYEEIAAGGILSQWDREQRILFVEYYKTIRTDLDIPRDFTLNKALYAVLTDMGKSEEDIMRLMGISDGALRTMRSRMR